VKRERLGEPPLGEHGTIRPIVRREGIVLAKALSCAVVGLDSSLVEVEVDLSPGLPSFQNVGPLSMSQCPADLPVRGPGAC
jgi:hypothetical protein